jgi:hypothetical protein
MMSSLTIDLSTDCSSKSWDELVFKAVVAESVAKRKSILEARKAREAARNSLASPASFSQSWRQPPHNFPVEPQRQGANHAGASARSVDPPMSISSPSLSSTTYYRPPLPPLTRRKLDRQEQVLNLIDSSTDNEIDSYPPIRPIIKSAIPLYVHQLLSDVPVKLSDELFANVSIPAENFEVLCNAESNPPVSLSVSPPLSSGKKCRLRRKGKSDRTKTLRHMELVSSSASSGTYRVMTPKTDVTDDSRVVHDYRALNENTIKDNTPLPRQDAILERMVWAFIRRKIDLKEP